MRAHNDSRAVPRSLELALARQTSMQTKPKIKQLIREPQVDVSARSNAVVRVCAHRSALPDLSTSPDPARTFLLASRHALGDS